MKINPDAWAILNQDEKLSISLSLGHNKSSWESGEIMSKSHYKYLEIKARAERFLRMFTEYFQKYGGLFPEKNKSDQFFRDYFEMLIIQRMSLKATIGSIQHSGYKISGKREVILESEMVKLKSSKYAGDRELFDVLLEFDRWNNFRVLPKVLQQPSAFKRRNKTRELKHLKSITNIHSYSIKKIHERFATNKSNGVCFFTLLGDNLPGNFKVIKMVNRSKEIKQISSLGFFIFEEEVQAITLGKLVSAYLFPKMSMGFSPVIKGLQFWSNYRELISKAINYLAVYNIIPNRKYVEDALIEQQLKKKRIQRVKSEIKELLND
jgi:hypothetical protein